MTTWTDEEWAKLRDMLVEMAREQSTTQGEPSAVSAEPTSVVPSATQPTRTTERLSPEQWEQALRDH